MADGIADIGEALLPVFQEAAESLDVWEASMSCSNWRVGAEPNGCLDTEPCPDCDDGTVTLLTSRVECERCGGDGYVEVECG